MNNHTTSITTNKKHHYRELDELIEKTLIAMQDRQDFIEESLKKETIS